MEPVCTMTCLIIGDQRVGKSALKYRQILGKFPDYVPGTGGDPPMTAVVIDGALYEIMLLDPSVDPEDDKMRLMMYQPQVAQIFLLCFSDRKSFENMEHKWFPEIRERLPNVPVIVAGLKTDLRSELDSVTYDEGMSFAEKIGAVKYIECSAKLGHGVKEVFEQVAIHGAKSIATGNNVEPARDDKENKIKKKSKKECTIQ